MFARKFTVVTPIFNGSPWLELCIRSVHDQEGIEVEHLIQDGGSTDGTVENYSQDARVHFVSEPDQGMYDAINRGFRRAQGDIILHLNGDEQLLPGTLKRVAHFFDQNPLVEMCFAYALVLDTRGELLCYRKTLLPGRIHTCLSHLCTLTCATFYRRSALEEFGLYFDPSFRVLGDAELICRALEKRIRMKILPLYTSAFTITGHNLSDDARAVPERKRMAAEVSRFIRPLCPLVKVIHRLKRLLRGVYTEGPLDYEVYTLETPSKRTHFHVNHPNYRWKNTIAAVQSSEKR